MNTIWVNLISDTFSAIFLIVRKDTNKQAALETKMESLDRHRENSKKMTKKLPRNLVEKIKSQVYV